MLKKLYIALLAAILLPSCYSEIEFDNLMPEPVPVINAVANPDTVVMASISRTYRYDESVDDLLIRDAEVSLYVNDKFVQDMKGKEFDWDSGTFYPGSDAELRKHKWVYMSDYVPHAGDKVEIRAATRYGDARVTDVVPRQVPVESVDAKLLDNIESWMRYAAEYTIWFTDPAGEKNYYLLTALAIANSAETSYSPMYVYYTDPLIVSQNKDILDVTSGDIWNDWGCVFSDETIDGQRYGVRVKEVDNSFVVTPKRRFCLLSISEDYYKYLRSMFKYQQREDSELGGLGLKEPVVIYSNVEGGTGIMASQYVSLFDRELPEK